MPVNNEHPEYLKFLPQWEKCRHFFGGEDEVKAQGEVYLPCLIDGQDEYPTYKQRARFFDAVARTVQGLRGAVNRKPHIWTPDPQGLPTPPIPGIIQNLLLYGRLGVLVDFDEKSRLPYYATYLPQDIINWNTAGIGDNKVPNLVVLREIAYVMGYHTNDEFGYGLRELFHVLRLDDDGFFFTQTYEKPPNTTSFLVGDPIYPTGVNGRLNYIPFVCLNARTVGFGCEPPPSLPLVNLCWHYYLSSADLQAGRHKCGLPILWSRGFPDSEIRLGSSVAYNSTDPNAQVFYTELSGNALVNLERDLEECKLEAAILGSRMLESTRPGVETAETTRIRQSGETATLADVVEITEKGVNRLMQMATDRVRIRQVPVVTLNRDFIEIGLDPAQLQTLVAVWQQGAISFETLFYNLKSGEVVPPDRSLEEELDLIAARPPQQERLLATQREWQEEDRDAQTAAAEAAEAAQAAQAARSLPTGKPAPAIRKIS